MLVETIRSAAGTLRSAGKRVSIQNVIDLVGGSRRDVSRLLREEGMVPSADLVEEETVPSEAVVVLPRPRTALEDAQDVQAAAGRDAETLTRRVAEQQRELARVQSQLDHARASGDVDTLAQLLGRETALQQVIRTMEGQAEQARRQIEVALRGVERVRDEARVIASNIEYHEALWCPGGARSKSLAKEIEQVQYMQQQKGEEARAYDALKRELARLVGAEKWRVYNG